MSERSRSIVPTRPERPRRRADIAAEEFVEFIEELIRTMDHRPDTSVDIDDGEEVRESIVEDVVEVDACPTEPMAFLREDTPPRPQVHTRTRPPPVPPRDESGVLMYESSVELLETSLVDTERMDDPEI